MAQFLYQKVFIVKFLPRLEVTSDEMLHLDLLRFIASVGIVFHHSHEFFVHPSLRAEATFTRTGGLALFVDLFFMISGFVIAYVYSESILRTGGFRLFLQRRFARLLPLHWLTFLVMVLFYGVLSFSGVSVNNQPSFDFVCIADTMFLLHGIIQCGNGIYFNGQSWSISAELLMYICFPFFSILVVWHRSIPIFLAFGVIFFIGFSQSDFEKIIYFNWATQPPFLRALPSFLLGIGVFHYRYFVSKLPTPGPIFWLCVVVLFVAMLNDAPTFFTIFLVYITVVFAVAADSQECAHLVKKFAPLGQLTYSVYMWHGLIIMVIMNGLGDKLLHANGGLAVALAIFCYATIMFVSYFSYFFVELPARRWVEHFRIYHFIKK